MSEEKTLEDRLHGIEIDLKHAKNRVDAIFAIVLKISKDGLKVKDERAAIALQRIERILERDK